MCVQCIAGASVAVGGATGIRAWLATRKWISPKALRRATVLLLTGGVLAAGALSPALTPS